ncbi:hypothetical protein, partial [Paracoccus sp. SY]|uniref:hypothetical protein n=1 Tax=Paracoccus sp. SY TaxID=1330255 RepID=UPI0011AF6FA0
MTAAIQQGLTDDLNGIGRFGRHPDPAIDFCIQVETLESRLHQAMHSLCKPGDEPETVQTVLAAIERALEFRVGGDEGAVKAKAVLRDLERQARSTLAPAVPNAKPVAWRIEDRTHPGWFTYYDPAQIPPDGAEPLYAHPAPDPAVPDVAEQIAELRNANPDEHCNDSK